MNGRRFFAALAMAAFGALASPSARAGGNSPPGQPTNLDPASGAADVSVTPTLDASAFSDPDPGDTHAASQWQVALDSTFLNLVVNETETSFDTADLTAFSVASPLSEATTYHWRARYQDNNGAFGSFSIGTPFSTAGDNSPPNAPAGLAPADGAVDVPLAPTLEASAFSDPNSGDAHQASRWQVALDSAFSNLVLDATETSFETASLTTFDIPFGTLSQSTTYNWRVQYQDDRGAFGAFSSPLSFTTATFQQGQLCETALPGPTAGGPAVPVDLSGFMDLQGIPCLGGSGAGPEAWFDLGVLPAGQYALYALNDSGIRDSFRSASLNVLQGCSGPSVGCDSNASDNFLIITAVNFEANGTDPYLVQVESAGSLPPTFSLLLQEARLPTNDDCAQAIVVAPGDLGFVDTVDMATATDSGVDNSQSVNIGGGGGRDVWYSFTPEKTLSYNIQALGFDTGIGILEATCAGEEHGAFDFPGQQGDSIFVGLIRDTTYLIFAEGSSASDTGILNFSIDAKEDSIAPDQPVNESPPDGATDVPLAPTLEASDFSDANLIAPFHAASQWQIALDSAFSNLVVDATETNFDSIDLTRFATPSGQLSQSTTYHWRVRYQDNNDEFSEFSLPTSFTTLGAGGNNPPATPANISPPNGATNVELQPTLDASAFSDPDAGDTHAASQWQVARDSAFSNIVVDATETSFDTADLTNFVVPSPLNEATTYHWRTRYQDNNGAFSSFSVATSFTTAAGGNNPPFPPTNLAPADGATNVDLAPLLDASAFSDPDPGDTHAASRWQIALDSAFSLIVLDETPFGAADLTSFQTPSGVLNPSTTYMWRTRYQDNNGAFSNFSSPTAFTTQAVGVVDSQLGNISTRGQVGTGDFVMIGGFVIEGDEPKTVLVTGRGPSLTQFGVPGALANPTLTLFQDQKAFAFNDNWINSVDFAAISQSPNRPTEDLESAVLATLSPGRYTAHLAGAGGTTGQGLVEVWDENLAEVARLSNISTRGQVGTGDFVMIGGFIIEGTDPKTVLITGRGPSLTPFGVPDALADPQITLFDGDGQQIGFNDNWPDAANAIDIMDSPNVPPDTLEAAILVTLQPGRYTAHLAGVGGTTGQGLVEVWDETPSGFATQGLAGSPILVAPSADE